MRAASAFSFLDGASLPEDLIHTAAQKDIPAMALIDTNGVYGAPRFYGAAKKTGVRAIVGAEVVVDNDTAVKGLTLTRMDAARSNAREMRHTLLVESHDGYRNLCKLLTAGALGRPKRHSLRSSAGRCPVMSWVISSPVIGPAELPKTWPAAMNRPGDASSMIGALSAV